MDMLGSFRGDISSRVQDHYKRLSDHLLKEKECIDHDIASRVTLLEDTIRNLHARASRLPQIEAENRRLKKELQARPSDGAIELDGAGKVPYDELESKFEKLKKDFRRVNQARGELEELCTKFKNQLEQWRPGYQAWMAQQPRRTSQKRKSRDLLDCAPERENHAALHSPTPSHVRVEAKPGQSQPLPTTPEKSNHSQARDDDDAQCLLKYGQNTSGECSDSRLEKISPVSEQRPDSHEVSPSQGSSPVVVSERPVRKRRSPRQCQGLSGHQQVKLEPPSSSPLQPISPNSQTRRSGIESLDLDEVDGTVITPRKRQRLRQMRLQQQMASYYDAGGTQISDADRRDITEAEDSSPIKAEYSSAQPDQPRSNNHSPSTEKRPAHAPGERRASMSARQAQRINCMAEDGDDQIPANASNTTASLDQAHATTNANISTRRNKYERAPDARRRLDSLMKSSAPIKPELTPKASSQMPKSASTPAVSRAQRVDSRPDALSTPRSLPPRGSELRSTSQGARPNATGAGKRTRRTYGSFPSAASVREEIGADKPSVAPADEPLRARPLHRLRLEDFRLNPKHNNYAYHESLRRHDEKKARSGCTDPFCQRCSEIAAFVKLSGFSAGSNADTSKRGQGQPSEDQLVRDFLGSDEYRFSSMSDAERLAVTEQARTKQFVDKFGKHRQGMSRAAEPPGFWDTEFPSTQESEALREEAKRMERKKIEERRKEALRGGMWMFVDEV